MEKRIDLSGGWALDSGESRILQFAYSNQYDEFVPDERKFTKTAACSEALDYASTVKPEAGMRIILVAAMGEMETWGGNKKSDAFPRAGILGEMPKDFQVSGLAPELLARIPKEWGYTCFTTKLDSNGNQIGGGNTFHEHINRYDASLKGKPVSGPYNPKFDPRIGFIRASFWNHKERRVELIQEVWESRAMQICKQLDEGFLPEISMACDVPWDRCSVCGKLSLTESSYCEHLNPIYGMRGKIYKRFGCKGIYMLNDFPDLFDSSVVKTRAATEAGTLTKIASSNKQYFVMPKHAPENIKQVERAYELPFSLKTASELCCVSPDNLSVYAGIVGVYPTLTDYMNIYMPNAFNYVNGVAAEEHLIPVASGEQPVGRFNNYLSKSAGFNFDVNEFSYVLDLLAPYMQDKSYNPGIKFNGLRKTASENKVVDLSIPFEDLSDRAKAAILLKIFTDKKLGARIQAALNNPQVLAELENKNMSAIYTGNEMKQDIPVYEDLANRFGKKPNLSTNRFYN